MKKNLFLISTFVFITVCIKAQTVDDGIKAIYYGKNKTAKNVLQKVVAGKSNDPYSIYWLGQAYIADKDYAGAKDIYQKALNSGVNSPWIWVGAAHVDLLQGGDSNAAKQKFEQAITSSKNKKGVEDPGILNAIGRANAAGSSKTGNPYYAIDKLKRAQQLDPKNPDIDINLGVNYLKLGSDKGGEAVQAFTDAIAIDPKYAAAYARIGRVYQSQDNKESMTTWYNKAIDADPSYGPVYLDYFDYYEDRDVNAAKEYLDKYVNLSDRDCIVQYFQADYLFRAGKYQESIAKADSMENGECRTFARLPILYAYNYNRLGDSLKAKDNMQKFFATATTGDIQPDDYVLAGNVYGKVAGFEDTAASYLMKASEADTVAKNKAMYIDSIASLYKRANKPQERLTYLRKGFDANPNPNNRAIFDMADAAFNADSLVLADTMYTRYKNKYPDQPYGYTGIVKVSQKMDTTGAAAVGPINDYIGYLKTDTAKNSKTIAYYYALQGGYYANTAKNLDSALAQFNYAVQYDPTNEQYTKFQGILEKAIYNRDHPKVTTPGKTPATTKPAARKPRR